MSFFSIATRDEEKGNYLSSFVNTIVTGTILFQERRDKKITGELPLLPVFGSELKWALKDALSYSGRYDKLYSKHFGDSTDTERGRNTLTPNGGAQLHSFDW